MTAKALHCVGMKRLVFAGFFLAGIVAVGALPKAVFADYETTCFGFTETKPDGVYKGGGCIKYVDCVGVKTKGYAKGDCATGGGAVTAKSDELVCCMTPPSTKNWCKDSWKSAANCKTTCASDEEEKPDSCGDPKLKCCRVPTGDSVSKVDCNGDSVSKTDKAEVACPKLVAWKAIGPLWVGCLGPTATVYAGQYDAMYSYFKCGSPAAAAAPVIEGSSMILKNPLGNADIPTVIGRVVKTFLGMVGAFALLAFVYAGILYMTAAGREEAITKSKDTMLYAFFGLLLIFFAYAITTYFFKALVG